MIKIRLLHTVEITLFKVIWHNCASMDECLIRRTHKIYDIGFDFGNSE
jgi:hypothetical protein